MTMKMNDIINKVDDVLLESEFEVLIDDSFIESLVRYNHEYVEERNTPYYDPKSKNHLLTFVKELYRDFSFLLYHIDDYQALVDHLCKYKLNNLRYLDAMILHYEVPMSPVLEMFLNRVYLQMDDTKVNSFSYDFKKKRLKRFLETYQTLMDSPDSKTKLYGFIDLDAEIRSVYTSKTFRDKVDDLQNQVQGQILKFQKLLDLKLLPDIANGIPVLKKDKSTSKISSKHKSDFVKIISAMYDAGIFVAAKDDFLINKQILMEDLGDFLNDDLSKYSTFLSQAKGRSLNTYMKTFRNLEKEALRYINDEEE